MCPENISLNCETVYGIHLEDSLGRHVETLKKILVIFKLYHYWEQKSRKNKWSIDVSLQYLIVLKHNFQVKQNTYMFSCNIGLNFLKQWVEYSYYEKNRFTHESFSHFESEFAARSTLWMFFAQVPPLNQQPCAMETQGANTLLCSGSGKAMSCFKNPLLP